MPRRSRSRSPRRDRDRGRDRSRDRDRRGDRDRRRDQDFRSDRLDREREDRGQDRGDRFSRRSRSPIDRPRNAPSSSSSSKPLKDEKKRFTAEDFAGKTEEEIEMMKCMGFGGFDSTKGKKVEGNDVGAVHVKLKRTYRQYMNRRGGFNRPLDAVH
ncbi:U4/U6.U5 small nuclear ribonucleoprotein 27 kDa protein-like isoform X2 [Watersipora subatra]|uniref:U4/U6.U5 small nuclear ribonucleoprotein 27 kDa protein-like isoform X2 n=1 Tax=Watersipora subatra TaxID=2589382 RepID=UPI00355C680E